MAILNLDAFSGFMLELDELPSQLNWQSLEHWGLWKQINTLSEDGFAKRRDFGPTVETGDFCNLTIEKPSKGMRRRVYRHIRFNISFG